MSTTTPKATTVTTTDAIVMSRATATRLAELLQHCEEALTDPTVRADLAAYCSRRPTVSSGWLIDMLAWHALHLRARLDETTQGQR